MPLGVPMTELLGLEEGTMEIKDAGTLVTLVGRAWGVTDLVLKIKDRMHAERNEILGFTKDTGRPRAISCSPAGFWCSGWPCLSHSLGRGATITSGTR